MNTQKLRAYRRSLSQRAIAKTLQQAIGERQDSLDKLGFDDYESYLASNLWASIRKRIFARAGNTCECCGEGKPANIHHWSYSVATLQGEKPQHLEAVCRVCHEKFHAEARPTKKQLERRAFRALVKSGGIVAQKPKDMTPRLVKRAVGE